jgi:outer membrane murein-binding lipoprotein Lpp
MPAVTYENRRDGCYLGESASPNIINEEIVVASGQGVLFPGTVIAPITASGKYAIHDTAASDGSQLPAEAVILFNRVDATRADVKAVATKNGPATINGNMLTYKASMNSAGRKAARDAMRRRGLKVLPQHAGE